MEFTGERFVSSLNSAQIAYEHWHRYLYAGQFVARKKVLDIACGEGYGADFFAHTAEEVFGVDISPEAVSFAQEKYKKNNLHFLEGSVGNIPIEGTGVFDVITSFETIEHVDEKSQENFLSEVLRLLKPDGIFIVSTPNKKNYSDIPQHQNKFHLKEFYREEFEEFLKKYFSCVSFLGQRVLAGSYIWPMTSEENKFSLFSLTKNNNKFVFTNGTKIQELYMIAVCSQVELKNLLISFQIDGSDSFLQEKDALIIGLNNILNDLNEELLRRETREQEIIDIFHRSFSWRITAPIRFVVRFFVKK